MSDHGYGAYTNGCRCDVCREAKRVYMAARRAAGAEPPWNDRAARWSSRVGLSRVCLPHVQHGTTGYRRGCRCWDCTDSNAKAWRERKRRRATA